MKSSLKRTLKTPLSSAAEAGRENTPNMLECCGKEENEMKKKMVPQQINPSGYYLAALSDFYMGTEKWTVSPAISGRVLVS